MLTNRATFHKARKIGSASDRVLRLRWTDNTYDDYKTVLFVDGWDYSRFSKNSPFQYCHDWEAPPLGEVVDYQIEVAVKRALRSGATVEDKALECDVRFSKSKNHDFSHLIFDLYCEGIMRATSCGFFPIETKKATEEDGERFNIPVDDVEGGKAEIWWRNKLFEISAVPLPGNENAVKGLEKVMTRMGSGFKRKLGNSWLNEHFHKSRTSGLLLPEYFGGTLTQILRRLSGDKKRSDWRQMESQVQSIIFSKEFWDVDRAKAWLEEKGLKSDKMDEDENMIRFRQFDATQCVEGTGVTLTEDMPEGVSMFACEVAQEGACPTEARIDARRLLELDPQLLASIVARRLKNTRSTLILRGDNNGSGLSVRLFDEQIQKLRVIEKAVGEVATFFEDKLAEEKEPEVEPALDENGDVTGGNGDEGGEQPPAGAGMKKYIDSKFGELKKLIEQSGGGRGGSQRQTASHYIDGLTLDNLGGERDLESALSRIEENLDS